MSPVDADVVRRRLEDRYVMLADAGRREALLGEPARHRSRLMRVSVFGLGAWQRLKRTPVLGPLLYSLYRLVRRPSPS